MPAGQSTVLGSSQAWGEFAFVDRTRSTILARAKIPTGGELADARTRRIAILGSSQDKLGRYDVERRMNPKLLLLWALSCPPTEKPFWIDFGNGMDEKVTNNASGSALWVN